MVCCLCCAYDANAILLEEEVRALSVSILFAASTALKSISVTDRPNLIGETLQTKVEPEPHTNKKVVRACKYCWNDSASLLSRKENELWHALHLDFSACLYG